MRNEEIIKDKRSEDKRIVLFLTLQDLQGETIKDKHKQLFEEQIDLLIVDETHFGARAESFGKIIKDAGYDKNDENNFKKISDDSIDVLEAKEEIKKINASIRLHLSGTPYRILMGSEFEKEDIISFVQFSDIVREQEEWDKNNLNNDDVNEWDNPYYGFPQMIRFAFNPNKSSRQKMEALRRSGVSFAFSKLFEPVSIKKDSKNNNHKKFQNESEIMDLLKVIDGSKVDEDLLGFLDYDKIKEGKMCRHMVMVLPYCASCDAMEALITNNKDCFKNLNDYQILNISGVDSSKTFRTPNDIKNKIKAYENENTKTLTLTVNRMLTGSTVEQWDTMMYFKDTASPQEYDQSIFRLQNQYIRTLSSERGIIKENLKPQTLLVDFDPDRLFRMQEQKSLIYNVNTEENGNSKLRERIEEELRISPVIVMNNNKIKQVDATNILEAVSLYNNQRSVSDEVVDIPIDLSILKDDEVRKVIDQQGEFNSKQGLTINPNQGEGDDLDVDDSSDASSETNNNKDKENKLYGEEKADYEIKRLEGQIKTYYQRLLFFAFLSNEKVSSIDDILNIMLKSENLRIANNLSLNYDILKKISLSMDPFKRSRLDYKIQNISMLAFDENLSPLERAMTSLKKFNRMSESEVITPDDICCNMVNLLNKEELIRIVKKQGKILDLGCKSGEFSIALYKRLTDLECSTNEIENIIYSIPTSSIAYEFTRRFYEILGLNTNNIISEFNVYNLIDILEEDKTNGLSQISNLLTQNKVFNQIKLNDKYDEEEINLKFDAVVGNPPYQITIKKATKGNNANTKDIYNDFQEIALSISDINCLLYPAKEYQRGQKSTLNEHLQYLRIYNGSNKKGEKNIPNEHSIFGDTVRRIPGDVGVYYWNKKITTNEIEYQNIIIEKTDAILPVRKEFIPLSIKLRKYSGSYRIGKIRKACESSFVENYPEYVLGEVNDRKAPVAKGYSKVITNDKAGSGGKAKWYYIKTDKLDFLQPEVYKVITGSAYPNESLKSIKNIEIIDKYEMFGRTKVCIYSSENYDDVNNFLKFLQTDFAQAVIQMTPLKVFNYMPNFDDIKKFIDWNKTILEINDSLFDMFEITKEESLIINMALKES